MKTQILSIMSLAVLLLPRVSWPMEEVEATRGGRYMPAEIPEAAPDRSAQMRIYTLRHYPAEQLAEILFELMVQHGVDVSRDERGNRLIVTAAPARLQQIEDLVAALDVPAAYDAQVSQMMYRVYMLELPSKDQDLKPFYLSVESTSQLPALLFFDAVKDAGLKVGTFRQSEEKTERETWELMVQGRAASNEAIMRVIAEFPDAQMKELRWDDDTFITAIPAAQVTHLPAPLQEHLRSLLGDGAQTVGYWFGNLSLPGEVRAPIGAWTLELDVHSDRPGELELEVRVTQESPFDLPSWEILSNSVRSRVGKPIIIGYNRDRHGTRTMGAMVIVPEPDLTPASDEPTQPQ